jgi:hypothetical protein
MSNTFINPTVVAKEALMQLENNCVMGNLVYRGYEKEFNTTNNGYKVGSSVTIKAPVYFRVKTGATIDTVELREEDTTFTVTTRQHVSWPITSQEMTQNIDKFSERFIQPAMQALADKIDNTLLALYQGVPNQVGTPGVTPQNFLTFAQAKAVLMDNACPQDNLSCVIDPWAEAYLKDNLKGVFNQSMTDDIIRRGNLGTSLSGFQMYTSQNVQTHTCGTAAGLTTNLVDDATTADGDTTITIDQNGSWSNTLTAGDIFTIAGVNGVNPISGASTGRLRQFVCTTAVTDAGNEQAISCIPGTAPYQIYSSTATETTLPYQNIVTLPADNAAINIAGTASLAHKVNLAFHKNALGLCMVPLEVPASVSWKAQMSENGYSIRVIRDYDVINDLEYIRFDVLYGVKVLNPFMACRIAG